MIIDIDKAIRSIRDATKKSKESGVEYIKVEICAAEAIADALQRTDRWQCVDDRLPEMGREVLTYAISKSTGEISYNITSMSDKWFFGGNEIPYKELRWIQPYPHFNDEFVITHWMELPRVPKGEWRVRDYRKEY